MKLRGRHWVALWLLVLLGALWGVAARQTSALRTARALAETRDSVAALEARRGELERRIRTLSSRSVLVAVAQRLRLRLPVDSEIMLVPVAGVPVAPR